VFRSAVALVTCSALPDLDPDDRLVIEPLRARGVDAVPAVWDDPAVDWSGFDLVVVRDTWDYMPRLTEFLAWADTVPALRNPAPVLHWNTHKGYLRDLEAAGVPVTPTTWLEPADEFRAPEGAFVIKPAVSAGSKDTGRYGPDELDLAAEHATRLLAAGRTVMVQPYLDAVDTDGETALLFFAGDDGELRFSHAARKGPMLTGPDLGSEGLYVPEEITTRTATRAQLEVAARALAAAPSGLLYARVDLIAGADGLPVLVELELTEPSFFLGTADGAADRFAEAVVAQLP
jgi:glutathione synthase/RimK-type ligase-like ATP-grasp enzyme